MAWRRFGNGSSATILINYARRWLSGDPFADKV